VEKILSLKEKSGALCDKPLCGLLSTNATSEENMVQMRNWDDRYAQTSTIWKLGVITGWSGLWHFDPL